MKLYVSIIVKDRLGRNQKDVTMTCTDVTRLSAFYRPSPRPGRRLPLAARSAGRYKPPLGWRDAELAKRFVQVFWGVEGEGEIILEDGPCRLSKGMVAVYMPGDTHRIRATAPSWEYRWWTMDGVLAAETASAFGLDNRRCRAAGICPEDLLDELSALIEKSSDPVNELAAAAMAYRLLGLAAGSNRLIEGSDAEDCAGKCKNLIEDNFHDSSLCVKWLADKLGVDRSHLCRAFRVRVGVPPSEYLQRIRMRAALSLLKSSDDEIGVIAGRVGVSNPAYFSRLVNAATGLPPRAFRARLRASGGGE